MIASFRDLFTPGIRELCVEMRVLCSRAKKEEMRPFIWSESFCSDRFRILRELNGANLLYTVYGVLFRTICSSLASICDLASAQVLGHR
jgi:hypothetical protein